MNIVLTTISIGENYTRDYACRLIEDILTKSDIVIYVTTDCPKMIEERFGKNDRIKLIEIDRKDIILRIKIGSWADDFNFNMKYLALEPVKDLDNTIVIFTDCDNSFDWWDKNQVVGFVDEMNKKNYDFYAPRIDYTWKNFIDEYKTKNVKEDGIFWHKIYNYDLDINSDEWDNAPLPAEYLLIFYNKDKKLNKMYDQWKYFHDYLIKKETSFGTWAEGFEIGVSAFVAGFKGYDIGWNHPLWCKIFKANGYKNGHRGSIIHATEK